MRDSASRTGEVLLELLQKAGLCPPRGAGERAGGSQVRLEVLCLEEWWKEVCKEEGLAGEKVEEWEEVSL